MSHFRYAPGMRASGGHHHTEQEEAYIVVAGSGRILLDGEIHELRLWDVVRISPTVVRAVTLEVDTIGAQKIALAASLGNLSLMLRRAGEQHQDLTRRISTSDLTR